MQDDDVWRRAFADNSGLFDSVSFGPLLENVLGEAPAATAFAMSAVTPPADPMRSSTTKNNGVVITPTPPKDFTVRSSISRQALLPYPSTFPSQVSSTSPTLQPTSHSQVTKSATRPQPMRVANGNSSRTSSTVATQLAVVRSPVKVPSQGDGLSVTKSTALAVESLEEDQASL